MYGPCSVFHAEYGAADRAAVFLFQIILNILNKLGYRYWARVLAG